MGRIRSTKATTLLAGVSLLAGCATTYIPTLDQPQARLRVVTSPASPSASGTVWSSRLYVQDLSTCPGRPARVTQTDDISGQNAQILNMPSPPAAGKLHSEFALPAGRPLAFVFATSTSVGRQGFSCYVRVQFTPEPGRDYEVEYALSERSETCSAPVQELRAGRVNVQRVPVAGVRPWDPKRPCEVNARSSR